AGAAMHVEQLATSGLLAIGWSAVRFGGWRAGTALASRFAGLEGPDVSQLCRALLPTAGVTHGLPAVPARAAPLWGGRLDAVVPPVVAINQRAGPIVFRSALAQAGEIG